jgi:hypothetical protein
MKTLTFLDINFDDHVKEKNNRWSQICEQCKSLHYRLAPFVSDGGTGICGIEDCNNESDYYIDFKSGEASFETMLRVTCASDNCDDYPELFYIHIDSTLIARVRELSTAVKSLQVIKIKDLNHNGQWGVNILDDFDISNETKNIAPALAKFVEQLERVTCASLVVTADYFYFTATPKHCNDDLALSTKRVSISDLDSSNPNIVNT